MMESQKRLFLPNHSRSDFFSFCCMMGLLAMLIIAVGCANMGREFTDAKVPEIRIGKTTQENIRDMFGSPWRVGIEDGKTTWTYGKYQYRLFGESKTKDLVIHFNNDNVVSSYVFNTTEHPN